MPFSLLGCFTDTGGIYLEKVGPLRETLEFSPFPLAAFLNIKEAWAEALMWMHGPLNLPLKMISHHKESWLCLVWMDTKRTITFCKLIFTQRLTFWQTLMAVQPTVILPLPWLPGRFRFLSGESYGTLGAAYGIRPPSAVTGSGMLHVFQFWINKCLSGASEKAFPP